MSTWPDPTDTIQTINMDEASVDTLANVRADILKLTQKVNQILGTMAEGATPWTDKNDSSLIKAVSTSFVDAFGTFSTSNAGHLDSEGSKKITNPADTGNSSLDFYSELGVKGYFDGLASNDWTHIETIDLSVSQEFTSIAAGYKSVRLLFEDLESDRTTTDYIYIFIGYNTALYPDTNICVRTHLTSAVSSVRFTDGKHAPIIVAVGDTCNGVVHFTKSTNVAAGQWLGYSSIKAVQSMSYASSIVYLAGDLYKINIVSLGAANLTGNVHLWGRK